MRRHTATSCKGLQVDLKMSDDWAIIGPTVEKIIARSKRKYVFSYFTEDDIEQEIRQIALKAYQSYDKSLGPLENFLARSISNRIRVNLKRDNGFIVQIPCITYKCHFYNKKTKSCNWDHDKCIDWQKYTKTYSRKTAIANPSLYPDEEMVVGSESDLKSQLEEMLILAQKRNLDCCGALRDFIISGKEIPSNYTTEVQELIIEVAR